MTTIKSKTKTAEEQLTSFIVDTEYDDLPKKVVEASKSAILDLIALLLAGSSEPPARILIEELKESGGKHQAGLIGGGFRTSVTSASLINGTSGHALDYDDVSSAWTGILQLYWYQPFLQWVKNAKARVKKSSPHMSSVLKWG